MEFTRIHLRNHAPPLIDDLPPDIRITLPLRSLEDLKDPDPPHELDIVRHYLIGTISIVSDLSPDTLTTAGVNWITRSLADFKSFRHSREMAYDNEFQHLKKVVFPASRQQHPATAKDVNAEIIFALCAEIAARSSMHYALVGTSWDDDILEWLNEKSHNPTYQKADIITLHHIKDLVRSGIPLYYRDFNTDRIIWLPPCYILSGLEREQPRKR